MILHRISYLMVVTRNYSLRTPRLVQFTGDQIKFDTFSTLNLITETIFIYVSIKSKQEVSQ